jgi:hypothetical protein
MLTIFQNGDVIAFRRSFCLGRTRAMMAKEGLNKSTDHAFVR